MVTIYPDNLDFAINKYAKFFMQNTKPFSVILA